MTFQIDNIKYKVEEVPGEDIYNSSFFKVYNPAYLCTMVYDVDDNSMPYWKIVDGIADEELAHKIGTAIEHSDC